MEANTIATGIDSNPPFYHDPVGTTATVWPTAAAPTVTITYIGTQAVSADPKSNLDLSYADVALNTTAPTIIKVQCTNVPVPPAGSSVRIRIVPRSGEDTNNITATYVSGDINQSIWQTTQIQFPNGIAAVQARAILPP